MQAVATTYFSEKAKGNSSYRDDNSRGNYLNNANRANFDYRKKKST